MCFIIVLFAILLLLVEIRSLSVFAAVVGLGNLWLWLAASFWVGLTLMREQRELSSKLQARMMRGELSDPSELLRPLTTMISGICLIIPGILTDVIGLALLYPPFAQWLLKKISQRGLNAAMGGFGKSAGGGQGGGQGPQPNPFGGWGGFGAPHNGGVESPSSSSSDPRSHRAQREAPLREGIHRTQRPQPDAWERERAQESRSRVNPQEVIIDVDAEVVDD